MTDLIFANKVRSYTKQTATSLTDAAISLLGNDAKNELAQNIADADIKGNYFIVPILSTLTAGVREYPFEANILSHIYSVEIAFTGTTDTYGQIQYILAKPDDFRRWGDARTEQNIQAHYGNGKNMVRYEIQRGGIYILSGGVDATTIGASSIANAIRIRYRQYPADLGSTLTDNTTDLSINPSLDANNMGLTFGMPKQVHEIWARRCSIDWKSAHPGAVPLSPLELQYETDKNAAIQSLFENDLSGETLGQIPTNDEHNSDGYCL